MRYLRTGSLCAALLLVVAAATASDWTGITPTMRCGARMVRDSANGRVILFGGTTVFFDGRYYNDVWEMRPDASVRCSWARLAVGGTPPQERDDVVMVYDQVGKRIIVFGGSAGLGSRLNDLWALNLTPGSGTWQQLLPSGIPPSPRHFCYDVYDPTRRSLIVFGGEDSAGVGDLNDVWKLELDSLAWHHIIPSGTPPSPRMDGGAAYDEATNRMLVFGGRPGSGFTNEVWALDLEPGSEKWTRLSPGGNGPSARAGFAYAQGGQKLFVSCGWDGSNYYNDLYALDIHSLTWSLINPGGDAPLARRNTTGAWDEVGSRFFIFGGEAARGYYLSDAYSIDCGNLGVAEWNSQVLRQPEPSLSVVTGAGGSAGISFAVERSLRVAVKIVDATGRVVRQLYSGTATPPALQLAWDGADNHGRSLPAGLYYCSIETDDLSIARKFALVR